MSHQVGGEEKVSKNNCTYKHKSKDNRHYSIPFFVGDFV